MKPFLIYLRDAQKDELDALARGNDRSRSHLIRTAIDEFLYRYRRKGGKYQARPEGKFLRK